MGHLTYLVGWMVVLGAACAVPRAEDVATRCNAGEPCSSGFVCYRNLCVLDESAYDSGAAVQGDGGPGGSSPTYPTTDDSDHTDASTESPREAGVPTRDASNPSSPDPDTSLDRDAAQPVVTPPDAGGAVVPVPDVPAVPLPGVPTPGPGKDAGPPEVPSTEPQPTDPVCACCPMGKKACPKGCASPKKRGDCKACPPCVPTACPRGKCGAP